MEELQNQPTKISWYQKLKIKWDVSSDIQMIIIFIVFSITGSTSVFVAKPILAALGIEKTAMPLYLYYPLRIIIIIPVYQVLLLITGTIFGQIKFFWAFEKKMLSRFGGRKK